MFLTVPSVRSVLACPRKGHGLHVMYTNIYATFPTQIMERFKTRLDLTSRKSRTARIIVSQQKQNYRTSPVENEKSERKIKLKVIRYVVSGHETSKLMRRFSLHTTLILQCERLDAAVLHPRHQR